MCGGCARGAGTGGKMWFMGRVRATGYIRDRSHIKRNNWGNYHALRKYVPMYTAILIAVERNCSIVFFSRAIKYLDRNFNIIVIRTKKIILEFTSRMKDSKSYFSMRKT